MMKHKHPWDFVGMEGCLEINPGTGTGDSVAEVSDFHLCPGHAPGKDEIGYRFGGKIFQFSVFKMGHQPVSRRFFVQPA
jgi:hypothetical protein